MSQIYFSFSTAWSANDFINSSSLLSILLKLDLVLLLTWPENTFKISISLAAFFKPFSLIESFKKSISADLIESKFTAREEALIQTLKTCKYKNKEWNIYRKYKILYPEDSAKR